MSVSIFCKKLNFHNLIRNKRGIILFVLLICGLANFAQNWTNLSYNPDQPGLEYNPLKGFTTLWNPGVNFPYSIQGHSFGLNELMNGMNSFNWKAMEDALNKDVANGKFSSIQVIIDPANGTTKLPDFLINQVDWKLKPGNVQSFCPDWNNEILMQALLNFIAAFGEKYNHDPRVFTITLGLYGMWGEWHVGSDKTYEMREANKARIANAYIKAFPETNLQARYATSVPTPQLFGYSDGLVFGQSWYFFKQLKTANADQNWKQHVIGGEIDPGLQSTIWQSWPNVVGEDVKAVIDSVHPTSLISYYVINTLKPSSTIEWKNAIRAQKMMGYTLCVDKYRLTASQGKITVEVEIQNKGVAPLYANWDAEIGILDANQQFQVIGITNMNLKSILPDNRNHYRAISAWNSLSDGDYTVLFRIVNPLEKLSAKAYPHRFANTNQDAHKSGWLTLGKMSLNSGDCGVSSIRVTGLTITPSIIRLPHGDTLRLKATVFPPDASRKDITWSSDQPATVSVDATGLVNVKNLPGKATITALTQDGGFIEKSEIQVGEISQKTWMFPGDTTIAWRYKYYPYMPSETIFALDSAKTIGIYGCNDTTGFNIRSYSDAGKYTDAAQFKWDNAAETFQKNGQWVDYVIKFNDAGPFQLLLRARNNTDANFRLTLYKTPFDSIFTKTMNLKNDFVNMGGGNDKTDWFLSKFPLVNISIANTVRFDWFDKIGEVGIFGGFSFVKSNLDLTPPAWKFVTVGTVIKGTDIVVIANEAANVYLVPEGTINERTSIIRVAVDSVSITANAQGKISTSGLNDGNYIVYAIDNSGNISLASKVIKLQNPVNSQQIAMKPEPIVSFSQISQILKIESNNLLNQINIFDLLGKKVKTLVCSGRSCNIELQGIHPGIYFVCIKDANGSLFVEKIIIN